MFMKRAILSFDKKIYQQCKNELSGKDARKIILRYQKQCKIKEGYGPEFLSCYYSPILTILKQVVGNLKDKPILEVGYRMPMFLDYLKKQGAIVYGIDVKPYIVNKALFKMSVEKISKDFLKKHKSEFQVIIERITLSKLYDKNYSLETGKHRFQNKKKILSDFYQLLKPQGILVLQDDRGTIFSEAEFTKAGFRKILKETPVMFKDKKGKNLGWNILAIYQKSAV